MLRDLRWYDDLDPACVDTSDESEMLEQDCYHVIVEDLGSNLQDENSGLGVENALSGQFDPGLAALAEQQLSADERVAGVEATITDDGAGTVTLDVAVQPDPTQVDTSDTISLEIPIVRGVS